jgi:hypothetical protein
MFGKLKSVLLRAASLDENKLAKRVFDDRTLQAQIIDLNTYGQLYDKGVDANGNSLGDYSTATIYGTSKFAGKIEKGARYDHITLSDSFDMYNSWRFINESDGFTLRADTIKDGTDLENSFGKIVGLTSESRSEIIPEVRERLIGEVRKELTGKGL